MTAPFWWSNEGLEESEPCVRQRGCASWARQAAVPYARGAVQAARIKQHLHLQLLCGAPIKTLLCGAPIKTCKTASPVCARQADFHYARGAVQTAFKGYVRSRDYCTSPRQVVDMCLAVIRCAVENGAFVHVNNYVSKASPRVADIAAGDFARWSITGGDQFP